ncbi:hypothetical protein HK101_000341 [Irineochytrium annulatum]|nr:hypothetical protein HK101_000341 [Irineochytrium annulatum]
MLPITLATVLLASSASAFPGHALRRRDAPAVGAFQPASDSDLRGPCPAWNIAANHGYFPRNGANITQEVVQDSLSQILNVDRSFVGLLASPAFHIKSLFAPLGMLRPDEKLPNGTAIIDISDLSHHDIIEHDASLTRLDNFFGDNHHPNEWLIDQLIAASTDGKVLTIADVAHYRVARYNDSKATNPEFKFGLGQEGFAWSEAALFIQVLGDADGNVPIKYIKPFFLEERLPIEEGWTKPAKPVTLLSTGDMMVKLKAVVGVFSG